jgi:hypothetical protein
MPNHKKKPQQTLPMQLSAMRSYARKRGWTVAIEVKDVGSGATTRPLREKLIDTACFDPGSQGVFGQGAKALRVGLYARVSPHM